MITQTAVAIWENQTPEILREMREVHAAEFRWEETIAELLRHWGFQDATPHEQHRRPWRVWDGVNWPYDEVPSGWRRHVGDSKVITPARATALGAALGRTMDAVGICTDPALVVQRHGMPLYVLCGEAVHTPEIMETHYMVRVTWPAHVSVKRIGPEWVRAA